MRQSQQPEATERHPFAEQAQAWAIALEEEFGVPFTLFDAATGTMIPLDAHVAEPVSLDPPAVLALAREGRARWTPLSEHHDQLALPLYAQRKLAFVAVAEVISWATTEAARQREQAMLQGWLAAVSERLRQADELVCRRHAEKVLRAQATCAWETLLTVDQLARGLRMDKDLAKHQHRILEAARTSLEVDTLIWIPPETEGSIRCQGAALLTEEECRQLARVLAQSPDFQASAPFLCNHPHTANWGACFPQIDNLMAFAPSQQNPSGWFLALNQNEGHPFRLTDAAILLPFLALLELHRRWSHRYQDLKELLVGLARSLTTALDAKDNYTFGHSERVARIAVELGQELHLDPDQLSDVYLAGLLHDVGKIGVRDTVLQKTEPLSSEEQEHIQEHVTIGYTILADLRQIRSLLPGVLYHHERYDGQGYPDGLVGEDIPLLARILAVADAYDAMSHPRPYRDAMSNREVEEVLVAGAGSQWDKQVVDAFCRCRQQIYAIRQRSAGDSLRVALDGALRSVAVPVDRST
ncbi:MAG TPA: HD-GYP domain-containing protein [Gemmataceae bacterium]|nr:HD-GYP domain-containing protein [Gemmataceae bacterium]